MKTAEHKSSKGRLPAPVVATAKRNVHPLKMGKGELADLEEALRNGRRSLERIQEFIRQGNSVRITAIREIPIGGEPVTVGVFEAPDGTKYALKIEDIELPN